MLLYISTLMMCCCCRIQLVLYPSYLFSNPPPRYAGDVCHQPPIAVLLHLLLVRLMDWALVGAFLLLGVLYNSLLATITIAGTNSRVHQSSGAVALAGLKARDLVKYTNLLGIPAATGPKLPPVPPGKADTRAAGHN